MVTLMVTQIRGKIRELLSLLRLRTVYVRRSNPPCLTTVYAGSIEKSMFPAFSLYSAMVTFARFWLPGEFENKNRIKHSVRCGFVMQTKIKWS